MSVLVGSVKVNLFKLVDWIRKNIPKSAPGYDKLQTACVECVLKVDSLAIALTEVLGSKYIQTCITFWSQLEECFPHMRRGVPLLCVE